jgi:hypothetical protein
MRLDYEIAQAFNYGPTAHGAKPIHYETLFSATIGSPQEERALLKEIRWLKMMFLSLNSS